MEGNFCRVTGSIRHTNDRRNIMAFRVAPLTTANEITNHLLETYYVKLKLRQLKKKMVVLLEILKIYLDNFSNMFDLLSGRW